MTNRKDTDGEIILTPKEQKKAKELLNSYGADPLGALATILGDYQTRLEAGERLSAEELEHMEKLALKLLPYQHSREAVIQRKEEAKPMDEDSGIVKDSALDNILTDLEN
ncbi:hypothetical protein [Photobacterium lutimaris]|uniref:Uncharacterized protein n=1 Tax=Photobacterium lutimaris TaxID=388278 RepID=A0A2T3J4I7_9GAMM|nr:hypothetical protein [Photobacterium lutimaris]PSU36215.1 hypothetical protein C9I99_04230 [Photobacterium lutimaris]TDR74913.1 hypothetical protein DFP78_106244 [Photobacterium lutimaris]